MTRGKYERPRCSVHGKGHRYKDQFTEEVPVGDKVRFTTFKICACGHRKKIANYFKPKSEVPEGEYCHNPWKPDCKNTKISVDIVFKGEKRPICEECWVVLSESDREW